MGPESAWQDPGEGEGEEAASPTPSQEEGEIGGPQVGEGLCIYQFVVRL